MSFLSDEEKADLDSVMAQVHATWVKTIYAHRDGELVVVSHDPNYSSMYGSPQIDEDAGSSVTLDRVEFQGRILFADKMHLRVMDIGDESALKVRSMDGDVRIKVDATGKAILEEAKKVEIEGLLYQFETGPRPHGLFDHQFWTYYLRRLE